MEWKTYLVMYFGTKGISASDIVRRVEAIGFKTAIGPVDFIYAWDKKPSKEEILKLADKLVESLKDSGAMFNLDTHD